MSQFITLNEDKFLNKSTYVSTKSLPLLGNGYLSVAKGYLNLRRIVTMPNDDALVMDFEVSSRRGWPRLYEGQVILLIDGETVTLEPQKNWSDSTGNVEIESSYYTINKDVLNRICNCKSFSMKLYCGEGCGEVINVNAVVVYSKLFYNLVYDKTVFTDVVTNALWAYTSSYSSDFRNIALDGSNVKGIIIGNVFKSIFSGIGSALLGIFGVLSNMAEDANQR